MTEMLVQSKGALCASPSCSCKSRALLWHPVNDLGLVEVMSLHRDHGMSSTCSPRVAFPKDSWGNFQTIHTWEEQQPVQTMLPLLLHSPSPLAPNTVTPHLPVMAPSFAHPAIYWHGNSCQQPQDILEMSKQSQRDLKMPSGDALMVFCLTGKGQASSRPWGCRSHHSTIHPEMKNYMIGKYHHHSRVKAAEQFARTF